MSITAYAGFSPSPLTVPHLTETRALAGVGSATYALYAQGQDTSDPSATFSFQWSIILPRTGQFATLAQPQTALATLTNISEQWGDIRVFLVVTNTATLATSETDYRLAPQSAFCTLKLSSANRSLTLPSLGSRDWWDASDAVSLALENLSIPAGTIASATINGAGELILTLNDGSTINAGVVVGADGANGADGADGADGAQGPAGPSQRLLTWTATASHHFDGSALTASYNPSKLMPILGPWVAPADLNILYFSMSAHSAGLATNSALFQIFIVSEADWELGNFATGIQASSSITMTQGAVNNDPSAEQIALDPNIVIPANSVFGVCMGAPTLGAFDLLSGSILTEI